MQKALFLLKNKLHKFTNAVFGPHQTTAAQYTLRHQKPLFFPHFSPLQHQGGHANENPSRRLVHTSSIFFDPTIAPHLKCNQTGNTRAVISTKTTFQRCTQVIAQNPYFYSAKPLRGQPADQHVDNQLTWKQEKRGQPTNTPGYIYMYIAKPFYFQSSLESCSPSFPSVHGWTQLRKDQIWAVTLVRPNHNHESWRVRACWRAFDKPWFASQTEKHKRWQAVWCLPLETLFFEINPIILCSGIDNSWWVIALNNA